MRNDRSSERGFSLVEVVIALGLMAGVLISVAGLFVLGGRSVNSGRNSTEALAVGRQILEEMNGWGFRQTYGLYGFDGSASAYSVDTRTNSYAAKWQPTLTERLGDGAFATVQLNSLIASGSPPAMNASNCKAIRVVVTVFWNEGARGRNVAVGTVRM